MERIVYWRFQGMPLTSLCPHHRASQGLRRRDGAKEEREKGQRLLGDFGRSGKESIQDAITARAGLSFVYTTS